MRSKKFSKWIPVIVAAIMAIADEIGDQLTERRLDETEARLNQLEKDKDKES